jgi:hypothetical protein
MEYNSAVVVVKSGANQISVPIAGTGRDFREAAMAECRSHERTGLLPLLSLLQGPNGVARWSLLEALSKDKAWRQSMDDLTAHWQSIGSPDQGVWRQLCFRVQ